MKKLFADIEDQNLRTDNIAAVLFNIMADDDNHYVVSEKTALKVLSYYAKVEPSDMTMVASKVERKLIDAGWMDVGGKQ